jgi:hypothetical protein
MHRTFASSALLLHSTLHTIAVRASAGSWNLAVAEAKDLRLKVLKFVLLECSSFDHFTYVLVLLFALL